MNRQKAKLADRLLIGKDGGLMSDLISRQEAIRAFDDAGFCSHGYIVDVLKGLPSAQQIYTDEEIQKMQDLESAEIEKAYQLGYEEGKKEGQSVTDCISRQQAIDEAKKRHDFFRGATTPADKARRDELLEMTVWLSELPSAQPERKKGRWLDSQGKEKYVGYCAECSACGGWSEYITDFCSNCGADMRGESDG